MTFIDTCVCQCYDDLVCYCDWNKTSTIKFKQLKLFSVISQHKVVKVVVDQHALHTSRLHKELPATTDGCMSKTVVLI